MKKDIKFPFRQGILDGLCGFYAIINSLYFLHPKMTSKKAEKMLRNMVKTKPNSFHKMFLDGTYYKDVNNLLDYVIKNERGFSDFTYETPFDDDNFEDVYEYLACLNDYIKDPNKVAIMSIGHPWHHWSVAVNIDLKREKLYLFDSYYGLNDATNELNFNELTIKSYISKDQRKKDIYQLFTFETIIVSKK